VVGNYNGVLIGASDLTNRWVWEIMGNYGKL